VTDPPVRVDAGVCKPNGACCPAVQRKRVDAGGCITTSRAECEDLDLENVWVPDASCGTDDPCGLT
jgi:hypothetical protein